MTEKSHNYYTTRFVIWLILISVLLAIIFFIIGFEVGMWWRETKTEQEYINFNQLFLGQVHSIYTPDIQVLGIITAYNPTKEQCDDDPEIMASGARVYEGAIACPREIPLGTIIKIDGQQYICEDRTSKKYDGRYDILMFDEKEAKEFGVQQKEIMILK